MLTATGEEKAGSSAELCCCCWVTAAAPPLTAKPGTLIAGMYKSESDVVYSSFSSSSSSLQSSPVCTPSPLERKRGGVTVLLEL